MVPRIDTKKVGTVDIFELRGFFTDPWVGRTREQMTGILEEQRSQALLMILRGVEKVDDRGAETILEAARQVPKSAMLGSNLALFFVAERMETKEQVPLFEREREAVNYFGRELSLAGEWLGKERRRFPRIKTGLPVEFEIKENEAPFFFEGVVTNLSEGGLYAYFLDSEMEELARRTLDPFDLKMLEIRLILPGERVVESEGKVLRMEGEGTELRGVGLEFYGMDRSGQAEIREFVKREGEREEKR